MFVCAVVVRLCNVGQERDVDIKLREACYSTSTGTEGEMTICLHAKAVVCGMPSGTQAQNWSSLTRAGLLSCRRGIVHSIELPTI